MFVSLFFASSIPPNVDVHPPARSRTGAPVGCRRCWVLIVGLLIAVDLRLAADAEFARSAVIGSCLYSIPRPGSPPSGGPHSSPRPVKLPAARRSPIRYSVSFQPTLQMSRAPQRQDRTDRQKRRLHLRVSRFVERRSRRQNARACASVTMNPERRDFRLPANSTRSNQLVDSKEPRGYHCHGAPG